MLKLGMSDIVTAFSTHTIGTKVTVPQEKFIQVVLTALASHDPSTAKEPGQFFIMLPEGAKEMVSCGVGRHTGHQDDYCVRIHRGEPGVFLTRVNAEECTGVAVIVYTKEAYEADPQCTPERVAAACPDGDETHVLVAVLGFAGDAPKPEVSSHRFTRNLAGGNNEYDLLARGQKKANEDLDEDGNKRRGDEWGCHYGYYLEREVQDLVALAKRVVEYEQTWCTVAD